MIILGVENRPSTWVYVDSMHGIGGSGHDMFVCLSDIGDIAHA